jgi:hypothetical protein
VALAMGALQCPIGALCLEHRKYRLSACLQQTRASRLTIAPPFAEKQSRLE